MPQQRLRQRVQATAQAGGSIVFQFRAVEAARAWVGSVSILGGQSSMVLSATVDNLPWGGWTAEKPSGPIQGVEHEVLTVVGTGFTAGQAYTAWWIGADQDLAHAELFGPANPLSVSTTVSVNPNTLDFQHNDALVATEPAVDFEDGGGITWSATDDPTNKRMKVAGAVAATSLGLEVVLFTLLAAPDIAIPASQTGAAYPPGWTGRIVYSTGGGSPTQTTIFEASLSVTGGAGSVHAELFDESLGAAVAGSAVASAAGGPDTPVRSTLTTPLVRGRTYSLKVWVDAGVSAQIGQARVVAAV